MAEAVATLTAMLCELGCSQSAVESYCRWKRCGNWSGLVIVFCGKSISLNTSPELTICQPLVAKAERVSPLTSEGIYRQAR